MNLETLLKREARTHVGNPIPDQNRRMILDYVNSPCPSEDDWDRIASISICPSMRRGTLWQGVLLVDPDFPTEARFDPETRIKWERIPSPFTVARAVRRLLGH